MYRFLTSHSTNYGEELEEEPGVLEEKPGVLEEEPGVLEEEPGYLGRSLGCLGRSLNVIPTWRNLRRGYHDIFEFCLKFLRLHVH